jgi:hypothetical protein
MSDDVSDSESLTGEDPGDEWDWDPLTDTLWLMREELRGKFLDDRILDRADPKMFSTLMAGGSIRSTSCCVVSLHHPRVADHVCVRQKAWYAAYAPELDALYRNYMSGSGVNRAMFIKGAHLLSSSG